MTMGVVVPVLGDTCLPGIWKTGILSTLFFFFNDSSCISLVSVQLNALEGPCLALQ